MQAMQMRKAQQASMDQNSAAAKIQAQYRGRATRLQLRDPESGKTFEVEALPIVESVPAPRDAWNEKSEDEPQGLTAPVDRERLCCDLLNTSVVAALVGGFALGNMQISSDPDDHGLIDYLLYTMSCFAVHACTCSCLTSALLYRTVVRMRDECVAEWAAQYKLVIIMPLAKFLMGVAAYLTSVILLSFRDLEANAIFKFLCLIIGVMSMSTAVMTAMVIAFPGLMPKQRPKRVAPK